MDLSYALFVLLLIRFHFIDLFSVNFAFIALQKGSNLKSVVILVVVVVAAEAGAAAAAAVAVVVL